MPDKYCAMRLLHLACLVVLVEFPRRQPSRPECGRCSAGYFSHGDANERKCTPCQCRRTAMTSAGPCLCGDAAHYKARAQAQTSCTKVVLLALAIAAMGTLALNGA